METKSFSRNQIAAGGIILALAFGLAGFRLGQVNPNLGWDRTKPQPSLGGDIAEVSGAVLLGANAVAVNDQPPGEKVKVSFVTLAEDGWVVIHEEHQNRPGNILGAKRFNSGANQKGLVELLRPTAEGRVYFAMLYKDDGDRQFDPIKDLPITDAQGNTIMMRFVATSEPAQFF